MSSYGSIHSGIAASVNAVNNAFSRLDNVAQQMSTLLRINSAADDPAGLVAAGALERDLITLQHTPGSSPEAMIQATATLSELRDADFTQTVSDLIKARIQARVSIYAFHAQLDMLRLVGMLFDRRA